MRRIFVISLLFILSFSLPVLAQDANLMSVSAENCDYGGEFKSIEAVDSMTVRFTLCYADAAFPYKVASPGLSIFPTEQLEATNGGGPELFLHPIGTGPYKLDHWNQGSELVLTRNDDYWGTPAAEKTLIFRFSPESGARLNELRAGTIDGFDNPSPGDYEGIQADPSMNLMSRSSLNVFYIGMNNRYPPFDNVNFRQAVAYAIDKQRIVDNFYTPGSTVATQFLPSVAFGYSASVEPFPYDPDKARELVQAAADEEGLTLPITITLSYREAVRGYLPQPGVVAQDIQNQLAAVGINVELQIVESGTFLDQAYAGDLEMYMLGWLADYADATNWLDVHFGAGAPEQFGDKYPELEDLLAQAAQSADPAFRAPLYDQVNTLLRDLAPMLPVAHGSSAVVYNARIQNANASPLGYEDFTVLEDPQDDDINWMQTLEPAGLYCLDEIDGATLRNCQQINDSLLGYKFNSADVEPSLAVDYTTNADLTEWTFTLRDGVVFHDGSTLDANDVVESFTAAWDASSPLHQGREGSFAYFKAFFGHLLNQE